jgi:hypothetical protein
MKIFVLLLFVALGLMVLIWGLPRANHHRMPWRWRIGIVMIGCRLILWPPIYLFLSQFDLEMVWIPVWGATIITFVVGIKRLIWADIWSPGSSLRDSYDVGWLLRPRPRVRSKPDVISDFIEDNLNPLGAFLKRIVYGQPHIRQPHLKRATVMTLRVLKMAEAWRWLGSLTGIGQSDFRRQQTSVLRPFRGTCKGSG